MSAMNKITQFSNEVLNDIYKSCIIDWKSNSYEDINNSDLKRRVLNKNNALVMSTEKSFNEYISDYKNIINLQEDFKITDWPFALGSFDLIALPLFFDGTEDSKNLYKILTLIYYTLRVGGIFIGNHTGSNINELMHNMQIVGFKNQAFLEDETQMDGQIVKVYSYYGSL